MDSMLFRLLLGHLVGDFLFQPDWMSLNKKKQWTPCIVHCLVYTFCVCAFMFPELQQLSVYAAVDFITLIFLSHIVVDRSNVVEWWFQLIRGRAYSRVHLPISGMENATDELKEMMLFHRKVFTDIVQTVADNTMHLVMMYFIVLCYFT